VYVLCVAEIWREGEGGVVGEEESVLMVMGTELAPGIVCCASLCGSLGVPHHVTPWEQHRNGGDPVKQVKKPRVLVLLRALLFLGSFSLRVLRGRRRFVYVR
jgi:hypothetical protein